MSTEILVNVGIEETRVARLENGHLVEIQTERKREKGLSGNIYKTRVARVLPGMQAAFLEAGLARTAFLYVGNILDPNRQLEVLDKIEEETEKEQSDEEVKEKEIAVPTHKKRTYPEISELINEGQSMLVQVTKEPLGTKGAQVTGYISIPGRFLVFLPESPHVGISKRIEDPTERERLRELVEKFHKGSGGFIVRTVAVGASAKNIKDDMDYLIKQWATIKKQGDKQKGPGLVFADLDIVSKILRDRVSDDVEKIIIDDLASYKKIQRFVQGFLPRFKKRIELYGDKSPLFERYGVEGELNRALSRKVWLKSGGYIVIDQSEALTAIDVNTGRFVGRKNLEETILQTNIEAAKEIAYQIRLRNIGGIIVLDFIDMEKESDRVRIYEMFCKECDKDPVKSNVYPVSELGLIQMTRKRTQESLHQQMTTHCSYCDGRGYLKSLQTISFEIIRECKKEVLSASDTSTIAVYCHSKVAEYLSDEQNLSLKVLEDEISKKINIKEDQNLHLEEYEIFTREE